MSGLHFVSSFCKHYLGATRIDVLHSPFVFNLYNTCIARQKQPAELAGIESLRKQLKADRSTVTQLDLGALKHKSPVRKRSVSSLAGLDAKPKRIAHILFRMIREYGYANCIDLGTSLGLTSACLAKALPGNGKLLTVEGSPEIAALAEKNFRQLELHNRIEQHVGNFDHLLPQLLERYETVDFALIDGNHTYEATMDYFHRFLPKVHEGSVLVFDDIYWSRGMSKAWNEIRQHAAVTVTVDLFYIGLVYFRREQAREHFRLRIL